MKFPFDFSITLVFRLVFPGLVLGAAALPLVQGFIVWAGYGRVDPTVLVPVLAVALGWLVVLCDQPIYIVMEGRRYWPPFLRRWLTQYQSWRLERIVKTYDRLKGTAKERADEVNLLKLDYPLNDKGEYEAQMPTRLGNLLASYERYPNTAYKLDAVFYWYRLWVTLDKDLRGALDETQAVADSGVYVSFALSVGGVLAILYALGGWIPIHLFNLPYLPSPRLTLAAGIAAVLLGYFVYRVSLFAQRSYGELFKSLFDRFRDQLDPFASDVAEQVRTLGADWQETYEAKYKVTSRYLRWHRIRKDGKNVRPESLTP